MKGKKRMLNAGRRSTKKFRIVGGTPVTGGKLYPWMEPLFNAIMIRRMDNFAGALYCAVLGGHRGSLFI